MDVEPVLHKPRSRLRPRSEPVQRLFNHYLQILLILNNGKKMGVNDIFKLLSNTDILNSKHKLYTVDALHYLVRENLVTQVKEVDGKPKLFRKKKRRRQKSMTELTESGNELSNLIVAINHFRDSYLRLQDSINKYFNLENSNGKPITVSQFKHRLKERGWEKKDFANYREWLEEVYQIQYLSSLAIIEALVARYFSIMFRFNLRGLAKEILTTLILDTLRDYLFFRLGGLLSNAVLFEQKQYIYNKILDQLTGRTIAYFLNYTPPVQKNRFIQSESIEIVESLCKVLSPSTEFLKLAFGEQATRDSVVKQQLDYLESLTTRQ